MDIDKFILLADSEDECCALNHGPNTDNKKYPVVDWLTFPMGNVKTGEILNKLSIPICNECAESLANNTWLLVYCIKCCESQWILRSLAKHKYPEDKHIVLTDGCPKCSLKTEKVFVR